MKKSQKKGKKFLPRKGEKNLNEIKKNGQKKLEQKIDKRKKIVAKRQKNEEKKLKKYV